MDYTKRYLQFLQEQIQLGIPVEQIFEMSQYQHRQLKHFKEIYQLAQEYPYLSITRIGFIVKGSAPNSSLVRRCINATQDELDILNTLLQYGFSGLDSVFVIHFRYLSKQEQNEIKQFITYYRKHIAKPNKPLVSVAKCLSLDFYDYIKKVTKQVENISVGKHEIYIDDIPLFKRDETHLNESFSVELMPNLRHLLHNLYHNTPVKLSYSDTLLNFIQYMRAKYNVQY